MTKAIEGEVVDRYRRLTLKQERFCQLYATEPAFFGNGVHAYLEAYNPPRVRPGWYQGACVSASRLLRTVKVCERINELLDANGMNDQFVDKQLLFLITQHSDLGNKMAAIREYNKLKARITEKIEHEVKIKAVEVMQVGEGTAPANEDKRQTKPHR